MKIKFLFALCIFSITSYAQTCPDPDAPPPSGGLTIPYFVCNGDTFNIDIFNVDMITSESWSIEAIVNENVTGQVAPEPGDTVLTGSLINTTNVIQIVVYQRTYTIQDCDFIFNGRIFVAVRPDNSVNIEQEVILEDDIESGSNTDGISIINLQQLDAPFISNIASNLVSIEPYLFFSSEVDAINRTNPLPDMYENNIPFSEVIYGVLDTFSDDDDDVFLDFDLDNECTRIVPITLTILQNVISNEPEDIVACDDDNDGIALFNLTQNDTIVLGSQNPADFQITYHLTQIDADSNVNSIANPTAYVSNSTTIYVRVEDVTTGAFETATFELILNPIPTLVAPAPFELCDDLESGSNMDDLAIFDLTVLNNEITGGNDTFIIAYFESQDDVNADLAITNPDTYVNITNPQTIFIVVTDPTSLCFTSASLTLSVAPVPSTVVPGDFEVCDIDNDGLEAFDLLTLNDEILNGEPDLSILYFLSEESAQNGIPAETINTSTPYINVELFMQTIFARVENINTGCIIIVPVNLVAIECLDTDDDGVLDEDEDLNNNGDLEDDDTDNDGIPNYQDNDDDGDTVLTFDEITGIGAGVQQQTFIDTDGDLIENYLDEDDDGDSILTIDEDYNFNGDPLDDDLNSNNIPDFLDEEVALSTDSFEISSFFLFPNPVLNEVVITGNSGFSKASIYDVKGQLRISYNGENSNIHQIDVSHLSNGVYFILIENTTKAIKLLKK